MSDPAAIAAAHTRLVEALAFYADPESYFGVRVFADRPCGGFADDFSVHGYDSFPDGDERPGKRARAALEAWYQVVIPDPAPPSS